MRRIEYRTADKSQWGAGPWNAEPDKIQWQDEATGLPCLMVRNHGGAWCGYVGVGEQHRLYGKGYGECVFPEKHEGDEGKEEGGGWHYSCTPQAILEAHGGLTFSSFCGTHTPADYQKWLRHLEASRDEARRYPSGDSARRLREWAHEMTDYEAWVKKCQAVGVCHLPDPGEPDKVWWFGFDCSHLGDVSPALEVALLDVGGRYPFHGDVYRDVDYCRREVLDLAQQLKAMEER